MQQASFNNNTICAISSPPGTGGVALIRVSGEKAINICSGLVNKPLNDAEGYSAHFCTISYNQKILDDVIITVFKNPHSFTGEDVVEISCHGSEYIQQQILEALIGKGCVMAQPGEFSQRAFFNGKMDLSQTEAIADLIHSRSAAAHEIALKQMKGGFSSELQSLREQLIHFASLVELELDFSEEDVEFADRKELYNLIDQLITHVGKLKESFQLGNAIKNGVQTVIAGRPNAGKSTLLNSLLNEERALVSNIPGTTRDSIEEVLNIKGIDFRLIDTAGIREATDKVEKMGVKRTLEKISSSSLLIYVYDALETKTKEVEEDLIKLDQLNVPTLIIANKIDLLENRNTIPRKHLQLSALQVSETEKVKTSIYELYGAKKTDLESTVVTNVRHYQALKKAHDDLLKVKKAMEDNITGDFLAMDIRQVLYHLGTITGEITTDDLLGNIFANFCIGK